MSLSVCINTQNAAATLAAALKSVKKIADEVIVVDMNSSDETVAIAEKAGALVHHYRKEWGYADPARNFALAKAKHDWILVLDADEEIPASLAEKIRELTQPEATPPEVGCFMIPRKNLIFGHWFEYTGWWPDRQPRLFRNGAVSWGVGVHRMPEIKGQVMELPAKEAMAIVHHNYSSVSEYIQKLDRYTGIAAKEQLAEGKLLAKQPVAVFTDEFLRRAFAQNGVADGSYGLSLALLQACYEVVTHLKKAELQEFAAFNKPADVHLAQLAGLSSQLRFWIADWQVRHSTGLAQLVWRMRRRIKW